MSSPPERRPDDPPLRSPEARDEDADPASRAPPPVRCRRCLRPISPEEEQGPHGGAGLCYWCAYVDSQG